jgi:hypothetical protein
MTKPNEPGIPATVKLPPPEPLTAAVVLAALRAEGVPLLAEEEAQLREPFEATRRRWAAQEDDHR